MNVAWLLVSYTKHLTAIPVSLDLLSHKFAGNKIRLHFVARDHDGLVDENGAGSLDISRWERASEHISRWNGQSSSVHALMT